MIKKTLAFGLLLLVLVGGVLQAAVKPPQEVVQDTSARMLSALRQNYAALKQVKSLEPRLETGHIVTAAVGNVLRTEADFLSLNSAKATARLVRRARAAGKDVAVWTVNDPEVMLRMIERGVDNIITDDPALLVRVMKERKALDKAEILGLRLRVLFDKPPPAVTDPEAVEPL